MLFLTLFIRLCHEQMTIKLISVSSAEENSDQHIPSLLEDEEVNWDKEDQKNKPIPVPQSYERDGSFKSNQSFTAHLHVDADSKKRGKSIVGRWYCGKMIIVVL